MAFLFIPLRLARINGEPAKALRKAVADESREFFDRSFFMERESPAIGVRRPSNEFCCNPEVVELSFF